MQSSVRLRGILCLLVTSLVLCGCASVVTPTLDAVSSATPQTSLLPIAPHFALSARMSLRVGERRDTLRIDWVRGSSEESLKLFSPFGSQLAEVIVTRDGARMAYTADGKTETLQAASVGDLTAQTLGVRLDTALLARWIQGRDLVGHATQSALSDAINTTWQVEAEQMRVIEGASVATRVTAIAGDTVVRVVIDEFRVYKDTQK